MTKKLYSVFTSFVLLWTFCFFSLAKGEYVIKYDYGIASVMGDSLVNENPQSISEGETVTLKDPQCPGFSFDGWYLDYNFKTPVSVLENISEDTSLYAKWNETTYKIIYVLFSPDVNISEDLIINNNPSSRFTSESVTLTPLLCDENLHYGFEGWYFDENFTQKAAAIDSFTASDVTLYARWEKSRYEVKYDLGEISTSVYPSKNDNPSYYSYGDGFKLNPPISEDPAFTFEGWFYDEFFLNPADEIPRGTDKDIVLYAKWSKKSYNITYVLTDENIKDESLVTNSNPTSYAAGESIELVPPASLDKGFKFVGFYTDPERSESSKITSVSSSLREDITIYAKWEKAVYKITYNYGSVSPVYVDIENNNPTEYSFGDSVALLNLSVEGFIFNGWKKDPGLKESVTEITPEDYGDITLYADFTEKTYSIEYVLDDKEVTASQVVNENPSVRTTTEQIELKDAETVNADYRFGGWYYDRDFKEKVGAIRAYTAKNVTVYAKWIRVVSYLPTWGDATLSDKLTAADARAVLRFSASLEDFDDLKKKLSDINNDGDITAADARLVLRLSAGLENEKDLMEKYSLPNIQLVEGEVVFS